MGRTLKSKLLTALLLLQVVGTSIAQDNGEYPAPFSVGTFRPVTASSTCGTSGVPESYCEYQADSTASLAPNCIAANCDNTCPISDTSPTPVDLFGLVNSFPAGVATVAGRPGGVGDALEFQDSFLEIQASSLPLLGDSGFTFAAWINQNAGNNGTLISKTVPDGTERNYVVSVSESTITFDYFPSSQEFTGPGFSTRTASGLSLNAGVWYHIAVTVYDQDVAFYVDGNATVVQVEPLEGAMLDSSRPVFLGQFIASEGYYDGRMQDAYLYTQALTAREVMELVTGTLPYAHPSPECHCPPSHPVVDPQNGINCVQHTGLTPRAPPATRINPLAHPPGFVNDFSTTNAWISAAGDRDVNITFQLTESLYEVIFVNVRYGSPRPRAAVLETSVDGATFSPIQYFAEDCMEYFNLPNDGSIVAADDVNCITAPAMQLPTSGADVRTRLLNQSMRNFDLDDSPELRAFILASHLRLRLVDLFTDNTTPQHLYYSILEVTIAARCACNGHSSRCGREIDAVCQCVHNTEGPNCERCAPLYNNKPWRYGTTGSAFPCRICNCSNHANSCFYNETIDSFPNSYELGGGGVCIDCQDDTAGVNCQTCRFGFYRPMDLSPSDAQPCVPCECNLDGVTDEGDCDKNDGTGGEIIGQCFCKDNVIGLQCDTCRQGFFNLSASNPDGCGPCECNTAGTFNAGENCDSISGQCLCKSNVMGLQCDQCMQGTTGLDAANPMGCSLCECDILGSTSAVCDPISGTCECRPGVGGALCDQCLPGFFDFSASGCGVCACNLDGSVDNTCNSTSGECSCLDNVFGDSCDRCADGFFDISSGCLPCECMTDGTVNASNICDIETGQCQCKTNVEGSLCDTCLSGFTNLTDLDPEGCSVCDCIDINTDTSGSICDPVTSQCECLATATGLRCDQCQDGFYLATSGGCISCDCDARGSASSVCDASSGQCECTSDGVGGRRCDVCLPGFFQFPSCSSCDCNLAGALAGTVCDSATGECACKLYVTGTTCDTCIPGFQMLEGSNPFGCSAAPDELAPPFLTPLSASSILLTWFEPEAPNGVITRYEVFRDDVSIANTTTATTYTDVGLSANTLYSYFIIAVNVIGPTPPSVVVSATTLEGIPSGITPPSLMAVSADQIQVTWIAPRMPNGVVNRYEIEILGPESLTISFDGDTFSTILDSLTPFTSYSIVLRACTSGGCGQSDTAMVTTLEAPPSFQSAPNVTTLEVSDALLITWDSPVIPNGIIIRFEVFQRNSPFTGEGFLVATVSNETLSLNVMALRPFTMYEYSVVSYTSGGGTQSDWTRGITAEDVPEGVLNPVITAISSSELRVEWFEPLSPNGVIVNYTVYLVSPESETPLTTSESPSAFVVRDLLPFTEYGFVLEVCTVVGCNSSELVSGVTLESVPSGQPAPRVVEETEDSISLEWDGPLLPNGIITSYLLHRRTPSLSPSPSLHDIGVAFRGDELATFSSEASLVGGFSNEVSLRFRTLQPDGTILHYINSPRTDVLAIELRNGVPWFVFDAGSGAAAIRPDDDVTFSDGLWHELTVTQMGRVGSITVDQIYTGTGESIGTDQVISSGQTLTIGAVLAAVPLTTVSGNLNPNATLNGLDFAGCMFAITINGQLLDFATQDPNNNGARGVGPELGCEIGLEFGTYFLGGGYMVLSENTITSSRFRLSFNVRTTNAFGLILFLYDTREDGSAFGIEIRNDSRLYLVASSNGSLFELPVGSDAFCDGEWHMITVEQSGSEFSLILDNSFSQTIDLPVSDAVFSSKLFIGGIPLDLPSFEFAFESAQSIGLNVDATFSGCLRYLSLLIDGEPSSDEFPRVGVDSVRFDGCPSAAVSSTCSPPWSVLDAGDSMAFNDINLNPFTEYLYRVGAGNSAGRTFGDWEFAMTAESSPAGVGVVTPSFQSATTITVTWQRPTVPNGLITRYDVIATPLFTVGLDTPQGGVAMATLNVQEPEMVLVTTVSLLQPATTYSVSLTVYTSAGSSTGPTVDITTAESFPVGVQAPVVSFMESRRLGLEWVTPTQPNGIITQYDLFLDSELRFSGQDNTTIIDNLDPFTEYTFLLQACTSVGCTNSSTRTGQTLPDVPMDIAAPNLTVVSPSSIQARWGSPLSPNGVILRYELRRVFGLNLTEFVIDFSGLAFEYVVTDLQPNTVYNFQLLVFNAGGFAASDVVSAETLEDIPDGISTPVITSVNATSLFVTWSSPSQPNGDIIQYILLENDFVVLSDITALSYQASDLDPFTEYSYYVMACTERGCGSSDTTAAVTLQATPEGYVEPSIVNVTPNSITLDINPVTRPNGLVSYVLSVTGDFENFGVTTETVVVYNETLTGRAVVSDLVPFTNYTFVLVVQNVAGTLVGPEFEVQTSPTVPEGFLELTLTLIDATTVLVEWEPPIRPNGVILSYEFTVSDTSTSQSFDIGLNTSIVVSDLRPFTLYEFFVTVYNTEGSVDSPTANITTGETAPSGFDQVVLQEQGSRYLIISWDPPAAPNGVLVNYTVLLDGIIVDTTSPFQEVYNATDLLPFRTYNFSVLACTSVGCVSSATLVAMTLEDVPEGVPAPFVTDGVGRTVLVSWTSPSSPNGIITEYRVERAPEGTENFTVIAITTSLVVVDTDISPFTAYEYRIVAVNSAGASPGQFTTFLTAEAAPEGVFPPLLEALSPSSIRVLFQSPATPNGVIISYTLTRLTTLTTITLNTSALETTLEGYFVFVDEDLTAFTNYTYFLTVCTIGGCTDSESTSVLTLEAIPLGIITPLAVVLGADEIRLTWEEPTLPNGELESYELLRSASVVPGINCCEEFVASLSDNSTELSDVCSYVAMTEPDMRSFSDTELEPFSFYQYCLVVSNDAGAGFSDVTAPIQTDPAPMPLVGPELNATTISSTAVLLEWGALEVFELLGPLEGYTLYGKISDEDGLGAVLFTGLDQSFLATGLIASTQYTFVVSVNNSRGVAFSNDAFAVTEEGIPANLSAPIVVALSSDSLSIAWSEPLQPNGVIILYTIFLDSIAIHNRTEPGMLVVEGLTPFTLYTVQVEACTQFGCTLSPLEAETTLESAPVGLASPFVDITGPTSANISWRAPVQPNGVITEYQLLQIESGEEPLLIFSGIDFQFSTSDLRPFTSYSYQVIAINGAGNVSSALTMVVTEEDVPTFVDAPVTFVISANEIFLTWSRPLEVNGMFLGYQLYRNGLLILDGSFVTFYSDSSLEPFTEYAYILEVCTNAGCTNSSEVSNTTLEDQPDVFSDPTVSALEARSISLIWQVPERPNGIITEYILTLLNNNSVVFQGLALSFTVVDLTPFTNYSFLLEACNSIRCVSSNPISVQTLEARPEGLDAPRLRNLTSISVAVDWRAPAFANGEISAYVLRRGNESFDDVSQVIFTGLAFSYNDLNLEPDTLYFYTVEVINGGGSIESPPSYIRTIPDLAAGIDPPVVTVNGPNEIRITWTEPAQPNGEISNYFLFMDDVIVFSGIGFEYTATDLVPFTVYSFYFEVCNQAGCASSITVSAITDQTIPEGVSPPELNVLGSTAIEVSWITPTAPNGVITQYEIRRRLLNQFLTETIQHVGGPSIFSFTNSGLEPFTTYEYRLRVLNDAGSTFSDWVSAMTVEDIPEGVALPVFDDADVFARNVTATWSPPLQPNGIILGYRLEFRLVFDPVTNLPGLPITAAEVEADVTTASVVGLSPITIYEFRVVANNSAGEGFGDFETVTTREDRPEELQPIIVEERTGETLTLTWDPPLRPNGLILEYMLLLDGDLVYRNSPAMYIVLRLQPFTSYSLQLAACTVAGCTFGEVQSATTAEVAPFGQPSPDLTALTARSVEITWSVPAQPNGIIVMYEILRQDDGVPSSLTIVFRTNDTLSRAYIDVTVLPASTYQYAIRAINSVGQTESDFAAISTPEAAPEGVATPALSVVSSSSILVSWVPPSQPNGIITQYEVFRSGGLGGATNESVYVGQNPSFVDTNLEAFTRYFYVIQACTSGGCAFGPDASAVTLEDIPAGFATPVALPISESAISISWIPPDMPNGIITTYIVTISPIGIEIRTSEFARNVTNLRAFTDYTVQVQACNSAGCVATQTLVQTLEDIPELISAPTLQALNATAVQVIWREPAIPNGVILRYDLRRNGTLILSTDGNTLSYIDAVLSPSQFYSYTIQAYTSAGAGDESTATVVQTATDTPENIFPPMLTPATSTSIIVQWVIPGSPNGVIQSYILYQDEVVIFEGLAFTFTAENLDPFTSYDFRLSVCTTTCGDSATVTERTREAPPLGQSPPRLVPNANTTVSANWDAPTSPNGNFTQYEVERRISTDGTFAVVFTGQMQQFLDDDVLLRPAMSYDYRVTAINSVGSVISSSTSVTLPDAAPDALVPPQIQNVRANSLEAILLPPTVPNGLLTLYRLYQNGVLINETVPTSQSSIVLVQVTELRAFTSYEFYAEICTSGGCGRSDVVTITTAEAPPSGFNSPPLVAVLSPRTINISWSPPTEPNGIILRYTVWYFEPCPQPPQPNLDLSDCVPGDRTAAGSNIPSNQLFLFFNGSNLVPPLPYSSYQFQVQVFNSAGSVTSPYTDSVDTPTSDPEPLQDFFRFTLDQENQRISLDWSDAFQLNGIIQHYIVSRNGNPLLQQPVTQVTLANEPVGIPLVYVITAVTRDNSASLDPLELMLEGVPPVTIPVTTPTVTTPTSAPTDRPFYQEAAFIIGMIVLGIAILFVLCAVLLCCLRPRGTSYKVPEILELQPAPIKEKTTPTKGGYSRMKHPTSDSWSPGKDDTWGEIPDLGSEVDGPVYAPNKRSYSPQKTETAGLLDNETFPHRLSDIQISTQAPPYPSRQLATASDDFDSYRASRTTFADTKV